MAAKPIIDVLLVVDDSSDEESYLPALKDAGYELWVREADYEEHRMLRTPEGGVHLHVLSSGVSSDHAPLTTRDRLRRDKDDRQRYAAVERDLARRGWPTMQHYAGAKTDVTEEIIARAAGETPSKHP